MAKSKIVAVKGVAPKKGQLPAGLVRWLKANGRLQRGMVGAKSRGRKRAA